MEIRKEGEYTVNEVTVPVVCVCYEDDNMGVHALLRAADLSKMMRSSSTFFNTAIRRAEQNGAILEEYTDYVFVDKETAVQYFGIAMAGVPSLKMYTLDGFRKVADYGFSGSAKIKEYGPAIERYYLDAATSISGVKAENSVEEEQTEIDSEEPECFTLNETHSDIDVNVVISDMEKVDDAIVPASKTPEEISESDKTGNAPETDTSVDSGNTEENEVTEDENQMQEEFETEPEDEDEDEGEETEDLYSDENENNSSVTLNGEPISASSYEEYDDIPDDVISGKAVKMKPRKVAKKHSKKKGKQVNKAARSNFLNHVKNETAQKPVPVNSNSNSGADSYFNKNEVEMLRGLLRNADESLFAGNTSSPSDKDYEWNNLVREIEREEEHKESLWQHKPNSNSLSAAVAETKNIFQNEENSCAFSPFFPDDAPSSNQVSQRPLTASERIREYAEAVDEADFPETHAAIIMMAAAVAAEGDKENNVVLKPVKMPKKTLVSSEALAQVYGTSPEVINKIAENLNLRKKKYGKFVTIVQAGDLMLVRFYFNKKGIRKFDEIFFNAKAEPEE